MTEFTISAMADANVLALVDMRDNILTEPEYQRPGGVWNTQKKQLFIDSLLNGYDVPKMYFHLLTGAHENPEFKYSIIDGRQRVETIFDFVDGRFPLSPNFELLADPNIKAGGKTFRELEADHPRLLVKLQSRSLSIQVVAADDLDFIEDMFSRLNEAVPLNAAEKRNAFGGPLPPIVRELAQHPFFTTKLKIASARYRHYDLATKMFYQEWNLSTPDAEAEPGQRNDPLASVVDTKKASLDHFVRSARDADLEKRQTTQASTTSVLDAMSEVFVDSDPLLKSSGMAVVYYVLFSILRSEGRIAQVRRRKIIEFETLRSENRQRFESEEGDVNFRLIEYDELAQSSNDAAAIGLRCSVLRSYLEV